MGKFLLWPSLFTAIFLWSLSCDVIWAGPAGDCSNSSLVSKKERRVIFSTEYGEITAVDLHDKFRVPYHLQFFTMDTSTLLLPLLLHTDMVFYVLTGKGSVSWIGEDGADSIEVKAGDIYRLEGGTVFYVQSYPDSTRVKLRIHAIFDNVDNENPSIGSVGVYSKVSDLVRGFDDVILQMGFGVAEEVIQGIKEAEQPPAIVPIKCNCTGVDRTNGKEEGIFEALLGGSRHKISIPNGKKKKKEKNKTFNLFDSKPDVENCNGKSIEVTSKKLKSLKDSEIGIFMVNLTKGSMMGPHWNPVATEIAVAIHGQGMVQVVCPVNPSGGENNAGKCKNTTFKVNEGDVFVVPRYHPMVQISFNNNSFVFIGFSTMASKNHAQFLAGKSSVLRTIDREILATSLNVANTTMDVVLGSQLESIMFECTSCAEELERKMMEERERRKEKEETERREEERKRQEEEEKKRKEDEERKREEEVAQRREEEEARKKEKEEEEKRREEEATRRREEEEARRKEEEEKRREEKEARRKQEQEEEQRREEEEERQREEEARRKQEEDEKRRREEKEAKTREKEEEATSRKAEEKEARTEEESKREHEEARRREEVEEKEREEKEEDRRQEEAQMQEGGQIVMSVRKETDKKASMILTVN